MTNEIITLECKFCGAPLEFSANLSTIKCSYCGHVHIVPDLIEQFARCPLCNRNDRVTKISAASKNQPGLGFSINDLPISKYEYTSLTPIGSDRVFWLSFYTALLLFILLILSHIYNFSDFHTCRVWLIIIIIIGSIISIVKVRNYKDAKEYNAEISEKIRIASKRNKEKYQLLKPVYERLYYCDRDDIIFLPEEDDYASPEKLIDYISKYVNLP